MIWLNKRKESKRQITKRTIIPAIRYIDFLLSCALAGGVGRDVDSGGV
jgi:hypothetical protein